MRGHPQFRAYVALAAVCFFWGTTYLGIRIALESFPPATLVCIRYLLSGTLMLAGSFFLNAHLPRGRELAFTFLFGILTLGIGNGALSFAEQWVPSGLAALFITVGPFWMIGMEAAFPGGERLHGPTILAMLVGLAGTLLLVAPSAIASGFGGPILKGFLLLQIGCCGWSFGSILQRRHVAKAHPVVSGAVQQLATGIAFLIPAIFLPHQPVRWSPRGVAAILYLVTFGSIVGYSAYVYALKYLPVSVVSLYNYVNPIVAMFLGFMFYGEHVGLREIVAMGIIFLGVALVKRFSVRASRPIEPPPVSRDAEPRHTVA